MVIKHIVLGLALINSVMGCSDYVSLFDFGTEKNPMPKEAIFLGDTHSDSNGGMIALQYEDGTYSEPKKMKFGGIMFQPNGKRVAKILKDPKYNFVVDTRYEDPGTGGRRLVKDGYTYYYNNCQRDWTQFSGPTHLFELVWPYRAHHRIFK